jgi:hypothetical protein
MKLIFNWTLLERLWHYYWGHITAATCPFGGGSHLKGEAVCYYMREFVKENAKVNFENGGVGYIYDDLQILVPEIIANSALLRKELEKASKTKSRLARVRSKIIRAKTTDYNSGSDENDLLLNGVHRSVEVDRVTIPITGVQTTSIHPQPDAANHVRKPSLSGDRNRCPTCHEYFNSSKAFDQHRVGKFNGRRRCLTVGEMETKNFRKTGDGFWLSPVSVKDVERLALLRLASSKNLLIKIG